MRKRLLTAAERQAVIDILLATYPDAKAELNFENPFQLLIATILSAQCTDVRVNLVTKDLFVILDKPSAIANIAPDQLETIIKSCGLYKTKAKNIRKTCQILTEQYDGVIPQNKALLTELPGVGVKTANVVVSNAFGIPAIAVDTHVQRVANRLGLVYSDNVTKTERDLQKRLAKSLWTKMHHVLIFHGRYQCKARKPDCASCSVNRYCMYLKRQIAK